jgi:hypothetical protein
LIAGILVSEGSLLANICKANKNQLAKLFVAKVGAAAASCAVMKDSGR